MEIKYRVILSEKIEAIYTDSEGYKMFKHVDLRAVLEQIADLATRALMNFDQDPPEFKLLTFPDHKFEKRKTFGEWLSEWYETYKKPVIRSWRKLEICIRLHIPQWIKDKELDDITGTDVQRALNDVNTSRNRESVYHVYTESLRQARGLELMKNDPMLLLKKPKHKRDKGRALTRDEQAEFLERIRDNDCRRYFIHVLLTGSRPGEPLRLRSEDIDRDHNQLHIRGTKTDGADRYIPLFPGILENLAEIESAKGRYFPYGYEYYQKRMELLAFHKHTIKDLRHTFATRALEAGVSMKTLQLWLGHSTYEQTANTYSHVQPYFEAEQAAKFVIDIGNKEE